MAGPVIATKLYAPKPRPGQVRRPRLVERLDRGARLMLVSAPAGFGKTTLLAEWLVPAAGATRPAAWLSLEADDAEPAAFWSAVVAALQAVVPGAGASLPAIAGAPAPDPAATLRAGLTGLLNDLAAAPGEVWLVLDDYHLVDGPGIGAGVAFLLDHLPPHVHVVISTRADPDLPLPRWRVRAELVEIRSTDLRFTPGEVATYLAGAAGPGLTAGQVATLADRTEGWIAALQLAALSLAGHADPAGFVARFAGDDRYVVDYLVEEVLAGQPAPVCEFLLRSAVLDRLTGPLVDAVTGRDDGAARLVALERANLFIVPLDDRREWYRYHHLFADVLRARLLAEQPDLVPVLHRRAGAWCQEHDRPDEAVRHALAAGDVGAAVHRIELAVPAIRRDRREAVLAGWLQALPDDVVRHRPVLGVFAAYLLMAAGDLEAVEPRLADAERALAAGPLAPEPAWAPTDELRTLPATVAIYRASLAQARGDRAGTVEQARRALELAGPADHLTRGAATGFLALAAWSGGDVPGALDTFTRAVAALHAAGAVVDELSSTVVLADLMLAAGRPGVRPLYRRALRSAQAHGDAVARAAAELHVGLSELELDAGDPVAARRHLDQAAALDARSPMTESRYRWFVARARAADAEGDPQEALDLLEAAEQLYRPGFFPDVRPIAALKARVRIGRGDLAGAAEWARGRGVAATDAATYLSEFDHLTLARLRLAEHREHPDAGLLDEVAGLLQRLAAAARAGGRRGSLAEIEALQAQVQAPSQTPAPAGREPAGPALSDRERQVLRLLDSELTGPQIARELFVSHNTLRTHTKHIFAKLDVTNRRAAVRRGHERGLI